MRELRIVDSRGKPVTGFGTSVFRELTGGRFVTLGRSDLSRLAMQQRVLQHIRPKADIGLSTANCSIWSLFFVCLLLDFAYKVCVNSHKCWLCAGCCGACNE